MDSEQDALARAVQGHVPHQPWSRWGNEPVPVEITFTGHSDPDAPWSVKFVTGLKGGNRKWAYASGATLTTALRAARAKQLGGEPR
jgi:hypothetical protein